MYHFWDVIIEPVLEIVKPAVIVEVGSDAGHNTRNLLEFSKKYEAVLHAVDPFPKFDLPAWQEKYGKQFIFHRSLSLNALSKIDRFDVVFLDGDHNWYTVFNELIMIEKLCRRREQPFPLIFLHDTTWPYGRRDLYYNPDNIPEAFRKPYKNLGIRPGVADLCETGGLNDHLCNSIYENDLQNGVLTALEDFVEESALSFAFYNIPGNHGLGVLVEAPLQAQFPDLLQFLAKFQFDPSQHSYIEMLESLRIEQILATVARKKKIAQLEEDIARLAAKQDERGEKIDELNVAVRDFKAKLKALDDQLVRSVQQKEILEKNNAEQKEAVEALKQKNEAALREITKQLKEAIASRQAISKERGRFESRTHQLETDLSKRYRDIEALSSWMTQLDSGFNSLLTSQRWKMGNMIGNFSRRMMLKKNTPMVTDHLEKVLSRYSRWKADFRPPKTKRDPLPESQAIPAPKIPPADSVSGPDAANSTRLRSPRGDIIVCIHNSPEDVAACIESIIRHTNLFRHRLILVDDGSDAETARLVVGYVARLACTYIRNEQPKAYTRAANQGLAATSGDFAVLLNSDTIVTPGWLDRLMDCGFSEPDIACVGPLSNAASWQTIPRLTDEAGGWYVNQLPPDVVLDTFAETITTHSRRLYPKVPFVNGFCYFITRRALDTVGFLDEENFPKGYGEEDDFSLRALEAGFCHKIADDCYVFHAKSKSYTPERRNQIVPKSKEAMHKKHDAGRMKALLKSVQQDENLLRARVVARLATRQFETKPAAKKVTASPYTLGWIQPHLGTVGGIRRVIEMTNRLKAWGNSVYIITPDGQKTNWLPIAADVIPYSMKDDVAFDVLMVSDPDVLDPFLTTDARLKINYHLAAYMLYREKNAALDAYYQMDGNVVHLTNSHWTREQVEKYSHIKVDKVIPGGIDAATFYPVNNETRYDVVCYGSKRPHKGTDTIVAAAKGRKLFSLADADLKQNEIAYHICLGKVFASACLHEGFNFCPLEAMACGVPVAMTDDGGSREYAVNGENALVVPPEDPEALGEAINRLIEDVPLRLKFIENGMETAARYTWDGMTADLAMLIADKLK